MTAAEKKKLDKAIKAERLKMIMEEPKILIWMHDPGKLKIINALAYMRIKKK